MESKGIGAALGLVLLITITSSGPTSAAPGENTGTPANQVNRPPPVVRPNAPAPVRNVLPPGAHPPRFKGFVDLHTHPLSYLGFGGKLVHGGLDEGSLIPTDSQGKHNVIAQSMEQALGTDNCTHGGWGLDNTCGDALRRIFITQFEGANKAYQAPDWARGFPADYSKPSTDGKDFHDWPTWDDIDHQKMWVDSIHRAYVGGLRVMVALAVNNKTLADAVRGPGDTLSDDDNGSAQTQILATKNFVGRHADFMEVAYSPSDLERIVRANKLAVILGVEVDNMFNINKARPLTEQTVSAGLSNLYKLGVRYIFPIHVLDNPFGGTAVYIETFNISNYYEAGHYWALECSQPADKITWQYSTASDFWSDLQKAGFELVKLGGARPSVPAPPSCAPGTGHQNREGLTPIGEFALKQMMKLGMLIDIDHMSNKSSNRALDIAEAVPGGYPLFSGHNNLRGGDTGRGATSEIARTALQYKRIAKLHGMVGVGTGELTADQFLRLYNEVIHASYPDLPPAAFGTDTDGLVKGMPRREGSHLQYDNNFRISRLGSKSWDYNRDGVAHYGMIADFVKDMESLPGSSGLINGSLMNGADYFLDSWIKAETEKAQVH